MGYQCIHCGKYHEDLPHIGFQAPAQWSPSFAGSPGCLLTSDLCVIEDHDCFVRGVIEIPVHEHEHPFGWTVWVSHKKENFDAYRDQRNSAGIGPFFGWLSNQIAVYDEPTLNLPTTAFYPGAGMRPKIVLNESDHLLYRHQQEGISLAEAWRMVHPYLK